MGGAVMMRFSSSPSHHVHDPDVRTMLAAIQAGDPDDLTAPLVLADYLDEWAGEARPAVRDDARRHAAFIRHQCGRAVGRDATRAFPWEPFPWKAAAYVAGLITPFETLLDAEWDFVADEARFPGPFAGVVNGGGAGVFYRRGLPAAVKCGVDLWRLHWRRLGRDWMVPLVCVPAPASGFGVIAGTSEYTWVAGQRMYGLRSGRVCETDLPPAQRARHRRSVRQYLVERALTNRYAPLCPLTRFWAVPRTVWRRFVPDAAGLPAALTPQPDRPAWTND